MASPPRISSFVCLLLLFSSFSFSNSSSYAPSSTDSSSEKVSLALYYESLCPYSANFIVNYLVRVFEDDELLSIVDLYLSPWGNAKLRSNDTFVCQHGPVECLLNTVEACAIDAWPKLDKHFPFIYCVEEKVFERKPMEWESCFGELALDQQIIQDCYGSGYGKKLELKYAAETNALTPAHQYVPWVVVNGQPLYEDYENFINYICKAYKGTAIPKACSEASVIRNQKPTLVPACYKDGHPKMSKLSKIVKSAISTWVHAMEG